MQEEYTKLLEQQLVQTKQSGAIFLKKEMENSSKAKEILENISAIIDMRESGVYNKNYAYDLIKPVIDSLFKNGGFLL